MEQFFYTETMTVMNADADFRSLLKPSALLRYVEQISTDHCTLFCAAASFAFNTDCGCACGPCARC